MSDRPVQVALSAASQDELNYLYYAFLSDQDRVHVATMATTGSLLEQSLRQPGLEVGVIDADLLITRGEGLLDFLHTRLGETVAVVLLSPYYRGLCGIVQDVPTVREVLIKPVNHEELLHRVYQIGISERCPEPVEGRAATPTPGQALREVLRQAQDRAQDREMDDE